MKAVLYILLPVLFAMACESERKAMAHTELTSELEMPPGCVRIDTNLYLDEAEVSNFSYLEFLYWTSKIYPERWKLLHPDTASWAEEYGHRLDEYYLRHPAYRNFPLVGISYAQAREFCKWRSDRVMEFLLIRERVIPNNLYNKYHRDSIFTIEKYFTGKYYGIKPNPYLKWYPDYSLPDTLTIKKALRLADSVNVRMKRKNYKRYDFDPLVFNCSGNTQKINWYVNDTLLLPVLNRNRTAFLYHLHGNVRELTDIKDLAFGGSYLDSCDVVEKASFQHYDSTDAHTGFRNMCRWKRWPGL